MTIIEKVAKEFGTTPDEVRKEMTIAIQAGMSNPDPKVQASWKRMFPDGKEPTPEQFIVALSDEVLRSGGC